MNIPIIKSFWFLVENCHSKAGQKSCLGSLEGAHLKDETPRSSTSSLPKYVVLCKIDCDTFKQEAQLLLGDRATRKHDKDS